MESATHGAMRTARSPRTVAWTGVTQGLGSRADFEATDAALIRAALHHSRRRFLGERDRPRLFATRPYRSAARPGSNAWITRRYTYRFFSFALAVLRRTTFAATRRLCALPGSAGRAAAALVRRTPG